MRKILKKPFVNVNSEESFQVPIYSDELKKLLREKEEEEERKREEERQKELQKEREKELAAAKERERAEAEEAAKHMYNSDEADELYDLDNIGSKEKNDGSREQYFFTKEDAEKIIGDAYHASEIIINHTLNVAETEVRSVAEQGYADGFAAGRQYAESVIQPALANIAALGKSIREMQDSMLEQFKDDMFLMVSEITKKVVHKEVKENDAYILGVFEDAIKDMRLEDYVTVTVSDYDIDFVTRHKSMFLNAAGNLKEFKIVSDKEEKKGALIIETAKSVVDASVEVQLNNIDYLIERLKTSLNIENVRDTLSQNKEIKSIEQERENFAPSAEKFPDSSYEQKKETVKNSKPHLDSINNIQQTEQKKGTNQKGKAEKPEEVENESADYDESDIDFGDLMMSEEEFAMLNLGNDE